MPTTTVAVSSPLNPTSTVTSSQVSSSLKDDAVSIITSPTISTITTISQNHETPIVALSAETAQLSSPTLVTPANGDESDIIKATVNGNNNNSNVVKNGSIPTLLTSSEHASPKIGLHSPISADIIDVDLNIKTADINCLNVITSSPTVSSGGGSVLGGGHFSNGHLLMAQNSNSSLNFQSTLSPTTDSWSIGDDNAGGLVNYSSPNNGQLHKRPIMSQQPHHGLSPNSSIARANNAAQQQFVHYNKNNCNSSNNFSSAWSNHSGQNSQWQQQQQQQMQLLQSTSSSSSSQMSLNASWNRGCSVPNLNPLSPHNMMHQQQRIHQNTTQYSMPSSASSSQHHQPPHQGLSPNLNSPSKYRRSTSYPGKSQMHAFPMDIGTMIEDQSSYMNYKVSYAREKFYWRVAFSIDRLFSLEISRRGFIGLNEGFQKFICFSKG
jgi:hypothetical protein